MKREKNPFEGSKRILKDEASYEDGYTVQLINFIVELVVTATLNQGETALDRTAFRETDDKTNPSI